MPKDKFSLPDAKRYIKNNYKLKKVDITDNYYRFRQVSPRIKHHKVRTISDKKGIKKIVYYQ